MYKTFTTLLIAAQAARLATPEIELATPELVETQAEAEGWRFPRPARQPRCPSIQDLFCTINGMQYQLNDLECRIEDELDCLKSAADKRF